jgi:hypothetical protein
MHDQDVVEGVSLAFFQVFAGDFPWFHIVISAFQFGALHQGKHHRPVDHIVAG